MFDIATFVTSLAGAGAMASAAIWLGKTVIGERVRAAIKAEYDLELERFKAQTQKEHAIAVEQLRSSLQLAATEHATRFNKMHEKMASAIGETYAHVDDVMTKLAEYVAPYVHNNSAPLEVRRESLAKAVLALHAYYHPQRIFMTRETVVQIQKFERKAAEIAQKFHFQVERNGPTESTVQWVAAVEELQKEAAPLFFRLEDEFRRHLGVPVPQLQVTPTTREALAGDG